MTLDLRHHLPGLLFVPGGLLTGIGLGLLTGNLFAGVFIGLGMGFVFFAFSMFANLPNDR